VRRALVAAVGVLALVGSAAAAEPPSAADLEAELVCPVCETTLDQSNAPIAERMKAVIRERVAAGDSEQEIKDALVAEFGPGVLATPPRRGFGLLAWVVPLVAALGAAVVVGVLVRRWVRAREPGADENARELDPELERLVDDELARFDA